MSATALKSNSDNITPAVHLEFIQNQLTNAESSGSQEIEQYHRALFLHHHAIEWETFRQEAKTHEDRLAFLDGRLRETQLNLGERTKLVPVVVDGLEDTQPTSPWNMWDVAMFVAATLGILC